MKTPLPKTLGLVFCGWLVLFWLCYVIGGEVPDVMGGRAIAAYPDSAKFAPGTSDWLQKVAAWAVEHSPFRYHAIASRSRATYRVAKALYPLPLNPGHSSISIGKDGWLFFLEESPGIRPRKDLERMAEHANWLARTVTNSGRRFCLLPLPDKSSVYPEFVGPVLRKTDRYSRRDELPKYLASGFETPPELAPCYLPLWELYQTHKANSKDLLYWEHDTHWNPSGMIIAVEQLIKRLQPGLWEPASVQHLGLTEHAGDIMRKFLLFDNVTTTGQNYAISRTGPAPTLVSELTVPGYGITPIKRFLGTHPKVIKGRTLIISDSFIEPAVPLLAPYFEDLTLLHFSYTGSEEMQRQLSQCDTLIFTSVERLLRWRLKAWNTGFTDYIEKAMASPPPSAAKK